MRKNLRRGALALALASGFPAAVAAESSDRGSQPVTASKPSSHLTLLAAQLVDLMHPDDKMVETNVQTWVAVSRRSGAADPVMSKLESEYPGVIDAAIANARSLAVDYARAFVRKSKALKTRIFAERLTEQELREVLDFFNEPAGRRLAERMQKPTDEVADFIAAKKQDAGSLTEGDVKTILQTRSKSALQAGSADEALEIMKFESRPVARKFGLAGQEADRQMLDIINNPDPVWLEKQGKALSDGAVRFVDEKRKAAK